MGNGKCDRLTYYIVGMLIIIGNTARARVPLWIRDHEKYGMPGRGAGTELAQPAPPSAIDQIAAAY